MDLRSAQLVGNFFINDYYKRSHPSLDGFYENDSKIGRPDANGGMVSLTPEEAARQNILSVGDEMETEIETADCHDSHNNGYLVVVRGFMTGADRVKRRFTQTFFLAPQGHLEKLKFYIRNDIFRFEGTDYQQSYHGHETLLSEKSVTREDASAPLVNGDVSVAVVEVTPVKEVLQAVSIAPPSLAKVPKQNPDSFVVPEKTQPILPPSKLPSQSNPPAQAKTQTEAKTQAQAKSLAQPNPQAQANPQSKAQLPAPSTSPVVNSNAGGNNNQNADNCSIMLKNLSLYTTRKQLQEIFQEFGELKHSNIQLRPNNAYGTSSAFLEFPDHNAAKNAIHAVWNFGLLIDHREIFASWKGQRVGGASGGGSLSWRSPRGRVLNNSNGGNRNFNKVSYRPEGSSDRRSTVKAGKGDAYNGVASDPKADVKMDSSNSNGFNNGSTTNGGFSDHRGDERVGYSNGGTGNSKPRKSSS